MVYVKKASGTTEDFSEQKVRESLERAGASEKLADEIVKHIKKEIYDGMPTSKIYDHIFDLLRSKDSSLTTRYNLKHALMELGPSGYPFEKFIGGILRRYGFETWTNEILEGECVTHEIDVIAEKNQQKILIECKFHNHSGTKSKIKDALYTYARFLDLKNSQKFDEVWLVTNTKVTSDVTQYAKCKGMRIVSWDSPSNFSLRHLIEQSNLHPVTALDYLTQEKKRNLLSQGVIFARDYEKK